MLQRSVGTKSSREASLGAPTRTFAAARVQASARRMLVLAEQRELREQYRRIVCEIEGADGAARLYWREGSGLSRPRFGQPPTQAESSVSDADPPVAAPPAAEVSAADAEASLKAELAALKEALRARRSHRAAAPRAIEVGIDARLGVKY